jgi:two-component system, NtrC family, response regulator AtoC
MGDTKRILIVDDDEKNRSLLKTILEALGYQSVLAEDGFDALSKVNADIDLILLDVMMPVVDGFEVARRIRESPEFGDVPIIMVTILTSKQDRLRAVEVGANDFISKPIDRLELQVRVASLLKMKEAQDAIKRNTAQLEVTVVKRTAALIESERRFRHLYEQSKSREELYHSLLSSSADAILICDLERRVKYLSPSFTAMFGWTLEEVEDRVVPYIPDEERVNPPEVFTQLLTNGKPISGFEAKRLTKSGTTLSTSISASRFNDHEGKPAGILVILRDITENRLMHEALQEAERRFRTLFQAAQDCIFVKDANLRYIDVNAAMLELLETPYESIIGKADEELFPEEYASQARSVEKRVLEGQTIETQQTVAWKRQPITFDFTRFPMRDSAGEIIGICAIARDVTERTRVALEASDKEIEFASDAMRRTLNGANLAAETDSIVLLTGESGSGKDHLARFIHERSSRSGGPFIAVNCAAIPAELAESELFGHEAGAFTGAARRKRGLVELAEGGTLLLNEVGELSQLLQAKLLTFLDTFSFNRVGGEKSVTVDVRLIAATNRELEKEVTESRFRKDLFYRLNVFSLRVPPLRDRVEDIPLLVSRILSQLAADMQLPVAPEIHPAAFDMLCRYAWPGNVRELRNVLERASILSRGGSLGPDHIGLGSGEAAERSLVPELPSDKTMYDILGDMERSLIQEALQRAAGKKHEAARLLGISRFALARHIAKLGSM